MLNCGSSKGVRLSHHLVPGGGHFLPGLPPAADSQSPLMLFLGVPWSFSNRIPKIVPGYSKTLRTSIVDRWKCFTLHLLWDPSHCVLSSPVEVWKRDGEMNNVVISQHRVIAFIIYREELKSWDANVSSSPMSHIVCISFITAIGINESMR